MKTNAARIILAILLALPWAGAIAQQTSKGTGEPLRNEHGVQLNYRVYDTLHENYIEVRLNNKYELSDVRIGNNGSPSQVYKKANPANQQNLNLEFYADDELQEADSAFHLLQLGNFLSNLPDYFKSDSILASAYKKYDQGLDTLRFSSSEILRDLEIIYKQGVFLNDLNQKEKELEVIQKDLELFKQKHPAYSSEFSPIEQRFSKVKEDKRIPQKLELYQEMHRSALAFKEQLQSRLTLEEEINLRKKNYLELVGKEFNSMLESEGIQLDELLQIKEASAEEIIPQLKKSIQKLDDREKILKEIIESKKLMQQNNDRLKAFNKSGFETIYAESVVPFLAKTEGLKALSIIELAETFKNLKPEGEKLLHSLELVEKLNSSLNDSYKLINDKYLQLYPPIYKKEVKPLAENIATCSKINQLVEKERELKRINDTLSYFQIKLTEFQSTDSFIDGHFTQFKEKLNLEDKVLYKMNIPGLESIVKSYKMANMSSAKSVLSSEFRAKLADLEGAYAGLNEQKSKIDSLMPEVGRKYQQKFTPIYKTEILQLESKKAEYLKIAQADLRYQAGKTLLEDLKHYEAHYGELEEQSQQVIASIQEVEVNYTTLFQRIVKDEIGEIRKDYKIYEDIDFVDKKLLKGKYMLEQLASMMSGIRELERNDGRIKTEMLTMIESFKKDYPLVYTAKIAPLLPILQEYDNSGYHQRKLTLSRTLIQSLDENLLVLNNIRAQSEDIRISYEEFDTYFQSKNQEKNLYKRTKSIYEDLKKEYDKEADPSIKTEKGTKILKILKKINEMRGKDNTQFNEDIKDAKDLLKYLEVLSRY